MTQRSGQAQQRFAVGGLTVDPADPDYPAHTRSDDAGGWKFESGIGTLPLPIKGCPSRRLTVASRHDPPRQYMTEPTETAEFGANLQFAVRLSADLQGSYRFSSPDLWWAAEPQA